MAVCQLIGNKRTVVVIIRQQIVAVADEEILMYNTMPFAIIETIAGLAGRHLHNSERCAVRI